MFLRASLAELGGVVSTNARWRRRPYSVTTFVLFFESFRRLAIFAFGVFFAAG
jgi:hypothetical protein